MIQIVLLFLCRFAQSRLQCDLKRRAAACFQLRYDRIDLLNIVSLINFDEQALFGSGEKVLKLTKTIK